MDKKIINIIIQSALASLLIAAANPNSSLVPTKDIIKKDNNEKCYGVVKAGMNDCNTKSQSCAGSSTKDRQADAFVFVPKGLCAKISGGSLKSG